MLRIKTAMPHRRVKVFFDGGCRPNPGRMEAAVVIRGVEYIFDDLGIGTSSDAEWLALFRALELSHSLGLDDAELIGDALMVIQQANRALANGHAVHQQAITFLTLATRARPTRIRWIKREQNLAGIALNRRHPR